MAARKIKVRGFDVEVWETSFRLDGMSRPIHVGHHITDDAIEQIINVIYDAVEDKADYNGRKRASDAISKMIMGD